jgi:DNA polymerase-3 subunit gamma/tau
VGKTSAARIFAKALNCVRGPTPAPCNECDVCVSVSTGDDVDVLEIDGASNRGIDEIRQLRQNVAVRPSRVRYKIYIIDEVHMLTKEAFNALLKTLEEPPEHVKFIFATTEPHKIPITILSRCQRFDFAGISSTEIEQRLAQIAAAEGVTVEPEALQILASRAAGSMRDSQSLLEQLLALGHERITAADVTDLLGIAPAERLSGLVGHLAARNATDALAELDAIVRDGVDVALLLDQLVGYFRDVMAIAVGCEPKQLLYALPAQAGEVARVGSQLGLSTVLAIGQILDQTAARMRVTIHGRTLLEMAVVRICQLDELDDLAAIVAELKSGGQAPVVGGSPDPAPFVVRGSPDPAPNETYGRRSGGVGRPAPNEKRPAPNETRPAPNTARPAPNEEPGDDVASEPADSVIAQWRRALTEQKESQPAAPPRESLRDRKAKVAEQPFVRQAMELFDVPAGQFRYTPPETDAS